MSSYWYDATVEAAVNAVAALLNESGGTPASLKIYTGTQPALDGSLTGTLLATLTFASSGNAFGTSTAASGTVTATANAITSGTAVATGTAGYFALVSESGATILTGTVGTSGADLNLSTLSITSGATVSCSSFTITHPQTGS
jgi:hypothetical protein